MDLRHLIFIFIFVFAGCTPQPSEQQKVAAEKELLGCLIMKTESMEDDDAPLEKMINAMGNLGEISQVKNKQWELFEDGTTISLDFERETDTYSCDLTLDDDGKYQVSSVSRNSVEIFNRTEDDRIKQLKAEIKENERVEAIKKWSEKSFSNASHKYYVKRHVNSKSESGEKKLKVVCDPSSLRFEYDDSGIRMLGRTEVEFKFIKGREELTKKFDLTSSGAIGKVEQTLLGSDVTFDAHLTHQFLDDFEQSDSISVDGTVFDVDNYSSVPCLKTRKEDLLAKKRLYDSYLSQLQKSSESSRDDLTSEVTYFVKRNTDALSSEIFGSSGSEVLGIVTFQEGKPLSADAFSLAFGTKQRIKRDKILGSLKLTFMNGTEKVELSLSCNYDYAGASENRYGYGNEYCDLSGSPERIRLLGGAERVRVSGRGFTFDSASAVGDQKLFVEDLIRIASIIATP